MNLVLRLAQSRVINNEERKKSKSKASAGISCTWGTPCPVISSASEAAGVETVILFTFLARTTKNSYKGFKPLFLGCKPVKVCKNQ